MTRPLKAAWAGGSTTLGMFVFSSDTAIVEIAGQSGFDFVIADLEHTALTVGDVERHVRGGAGCDLPVLVRIPGGYDAALAARMLDVGAAGVVIPHFGKDLDATRRVVEALRYPPQGRRPACSGVRAARYGATAFAVYGRAADADVVSIGLIEDVECAEHVESVLAACTPDAVLPGPGDLATAMGLAGQPTHPRVRAAVERIAVAARAVGARVGFYLNTVEEARQWRHLEPDFFVYLIDLKLIAQAMTSTVDGLRAGMPAARTGSGSHA